MADIQGFLSRLKKVKRTGEGRWRAICPAHESKHGTLSLAVRDAGDGRILVKCFAGCGAVDVVESVGLDLAYLMPDKRLGEFRPERAPFLPSDAFDVLRQEIAVLSVISCDAAAGEAHDAERLAVARDRIAAIGRACYGRA